MGNQLIKVLHILPSLESGGIESVIFDYTKNINKNEIQFSFVCHVKGGLIYQQLIDLGYNVHYISPKKEGILSYLNHLVSILRTGKYDIVHIHQGHMSALPLFLSFLYRVKVRIAHIHWMGYKENLVKKIINKVLSFCVKILATHKFACSLEAANYLYGTNFVLKHKVIVMRNAIDLNRFRISKNHKEYYQKLFNIEDEFVIGMIARFTFEKNHVFAINFFKHLIDINVNEGKMKLILIGDGPLKNEIISDVNKLGLSKKVKFLGNRDDVPELLNFIDIIIQPSLYEGLGRSIVEAQAMGIKSIISDVIPIEVNITGLVRFCSLEKGFESWSDVLKEQLEYSKKSFLDDIVKNGYCIKEEAKKINTFYINSINKK